MMKEAINLSKTGTFGRVLEEREFTEDEKTVLLHFFTNIDKNIYAATDSMPNSLWALLEGGYSRSQMSMRMRFLTIFDEMLEEFKSGKLSKEEIVTVKDFADKLRSGGSLNLSFFLGRAEQFMRKWAVQYGHDSLKDSDVVRFAVENITQFATSPVEEARLGAYQEKSTRYVNISNEFLVVPTDLKEFEDDVRAWNRLLISNYDESKSIVGGFVAKRLNRAEFKSEAAFERTVNAKTFDIVRYFLPATSLTSLGVVWPTREAERHISRLMSDPREEVRSIGRALLEEGKKVSPGLLSHVVVNEYQQKRTSAVCEIHKSVSMNRHPPEAGRSSDAVKLISISPNVEAHIAAAILFEHSHHVHSYGDYLQHCLRDNSFTEHVLKHYLETRGKFDSVPISTEVGNILFEVTVDLGAYRDIKRHRRNLFLCAPFTALIGFEYPEYVADEPELAEIKKRIDFCAQKTAELHEKIKAKYSQLASYVVMFANKQKMLWQMDPRQLAYVVELRTTPAGHYSYRTICQEMFKLVEPHLPILSKYIRVDMSRGEEGRKKQEERTVEKLAALGADVKRVS